MNQERRDRHFLRRCLTISEASKDPRTKVGAIIVGPQGEQRSDGWNGLARGIGDTSDRLYDRELKLRLTVHAEHNAILNAARIGVSTIGCTLYLAAQDETLIPFGGTPCTNCVLSVIQAGIVEIVSYPFKYGFSNWRENIEFGRPLLDEAGIRCREITP